MQQPPFTLVGNVVTDPQLRMTKDGVPVANFRVASTPSRYDSAAGEWRDGETIFMSVSCWRSTAQNVHASLRKGDPVMVTGRFAQRSFAGKDGQQRTSDEIEATAVGPDLARGTANFTRSRTPDAAATPTTAVVEPDRQPEETGARPAGESGAGDTASVEAGARNRARREAAA